MKIAIKTFRIINIVLLCIVAVILAVTIFVLTLAAAKGNGISFFGTRYLRVLTGSMTPTYTASDILAIKKAGFDTIEIGDVITFSAEENGELIYVTHRVVSVDKDAGTVRTRGDACALPDPVPVTKDNYVGKVVKKSGFMTGLFNAFSSRIGYFFIVLLPCMTSAVVETLAFLAAIFSFSDMRVALIKERAYKWKQSTYNMPIDKRRVEFAIQFGKYKKILGENAFIFKEEKSSPNDRVFTLTKKDIVVPPFACGDFVFMSLETTANRQVFDKQGNKKKIKTMIWKPQSNNSNDMKDVNVTVINVDHSKFNFKHPIESIKNIFIK